LERLLLLLIFLTGCASYPFEDWSKEDTTRQLVVTGLIAADWVQTEEIKSNSAFRELNPMASKNNINLYFPVCAVAHVAVSGFLNPEYRKAWQYISIGAQGATVYHNHQIGVRP
jgi:hypothetical protein